MRLGTGLMIGGAALAGGIALSCRRRNREMNFRGKVILITGGSHGLGLALAREFVRAGARLALCGRNKDSLAAARDDLAHYGAEVFITPCDVGRRDEAEAAVKRTIDHYNRLDVLVNNAGVIQAGPITAATVEDFQQAMDVMFWGVVYTSFAALSYLRLRSEARIVNITSVGGKVAVPHLLPYACAKFAATAFSEGLRAELSATPVKVVTIAPGLMRTGGHLNATFKGDAEREAAWFSIAASMPGISMPASRAARQILRAAAAGCAEKTLGLPANFIARLNGIFPGFTSDLMGIINGFLPEGGSEKKTGAETEILRRPWMRALTILGERGAKNLLQPAMRGSQPTSA